jgi:hypothetical protein
MKGLNFTKCLKKFKDLSFSEVIMKTCDANGIIDEK